MLTKIMQGVSIAGLLLAVLWPPSEDYQLLLQFVVCAGAILVAWEGYRLAKHLWAIGFFSIALLFNPIQPLTFSREMLLWLELLAIATFLVSLAVLKAKPRLSMRSIAS